MKTIQEEIAELRKMPASDLVATYRELWGKEPRCRNKEHLWKRCAWRLQEIRFGGLSKVAKDRLEQLLGEIELPLSEKQRTVSGTLNRPPRPNDPPVGTTLIRVWRDKELRVQVVEGGFEHEGTVFKTISETARVITGAHWNGRLFFGLTERKKAK